MSSWDAGEVLELTRRGNDYARRVWLGGNKGNGNGVPRVGTGGRPREGDDVAVFKRFVVAVYEEKRYYNENNGGDENNGGENDSMAAPAAARPLPSAAAATDRQTKQQKPQKHKQQKQQRRAPKPKPIPTVAPSAAAAPAVDLLDFGAFDDALPAVPAAAVPAPSSLIANEEPLFDPFNTSNNSMTIPPTHGTIAINTTTGNAGA